MRILQVSPPDEDHRRSDAVVAQRRYVASRLAGGPLHALLRGRRGGCTVVFPDLAKFAPGPRESTLSGLFRSVGSPRRLPVLPRSYAPQALSRLLPARHLGQEPRFSKRKPTVGFSDDEVVPLFLSKSWPSLSRRVGPRGGGRRRRLHGP